MHFFICERFFPLLYYYSLLLYLIFNILELPVLIPQLIYNVSAQLNCSKIYQQLDNFEYLLSGNYIKPITSPQIE